jgi:multidrug efflux pump subunit AcrA (membrane-fusion protein)
MGISQEIQQPVFHGPKGTESQPFILSAQKSIASQRPQPPKTPTVMETGKISVWITGQSGEISAQVKKAIENSEFSKINQDQPDVILDIKDTEAQLHSPVGKRLKIIPLTSDGVGQIMKALEGVFIVRELAGLENPDAPFSVKLWIDEPGKTQFKLGDRVTLFYKVSDLPAKTKAFLTLMNIAPDGTVSILYPQKEDFHQGPGEKWYLNAEIIPGKTYSIPKTRQDLKPGQNVAVDVRIRLEEGQEYFKAIVTSEPIDWDSLNIGEFRLRFTGQSARSIAGMTSERTRTAPFWCAASLRAEVRP